MSGRERVRRGRRTRRSPARNPIRSRRARCAARCLRPRPRIGRRDRASGWSDAAACAAARPQL